MKKSICLLGVFVRSFEANYQYEENNIPDISLIPVD